LLLSVPSPAVEAMHGGEAHPGAHTILKAGGFAETRPSRWHWTANELSFRINGDCPIWQQKGSGDVYAYTPDGGIRLKGSASGIASLAGQTTVAIIALCAALVHYILVALISLTATFSKSETKRDAALEVLKVLTRQASRAEHVSPSTSETDRSN